MRWWKSIRRYIIESGAHLCYLFGLFELLLFRPARGLVFESIQMRFTQLYTCSLAPFAQGGRNCLLVRVFVFWCLTSVAFVAEPMLNRGFAGGSVAL